MEKLCNIAVFDDGSEFVEIDWINYNGNLYSILSLINNPDDFCVKKIINENGKDCILALDSKEEVETILEIFKNKYSS